MMRKRSDTAILSIVPLVPIPLGKSPFFSYLSKGASVPEGSVVSISFGSRMVHGVVWDGDTGESSPSARRFRYKTIGKTLAPSFLPEPTRRFAEFVSRETRVALGVALGKFIPKIFTSSQKSQSRSIPPIPASSAKKFRLTPEQRTASREILRASARPLLLFGPPASGKTYVFFDLIRNLLESDGQALVLVPDYAVLAQEMLRYQKIFGRRLVVPFHARMKAREKEAVRADIRNGIARIVIGTGSALFLPFQKLNLLIEDSADAPSYLETIAPLHAIPSSVLAEQLAAQHTARLVRASSTPSFSSYFIAKEEHRLIELPPYRRRNVSWHTVNLRLEKWKKKLSPISEELKFAIAAAVEKKQQAILFVHRSGMSAFSVCADCKAVFRCPICRRPFSYRAEGDYRCSRCHIASGATPSCPACGSIAFTHIGIGTERVERDLRRKFPAIRSVRYDAKTEKLKKTEIEIRNFIAGTVDILITTERGIRGWDLPRVSLVGMIDADTILGSSGWDSDEHAFRAFLSTGGCAGRDGTPGDAYLQTFHPENPLFGFLASEDSIGFFSALEEERADFLYPPFGRVTRLVCRLASEQTLLEETDRVLSLLEAKKKTLRQKTFITPSEISRRSNEKTSERGILIREARRFVEENSSFSVFEDIIASLSAEWTIKRDCL